MNKSRTQQPSNWSLEKYLGQHQNRIEERLSELPLATGRPTRVREAVRYVLASPGKRFRPLLTIAVADIYRKGHLELVLDAAVAIECIHTSSLIFDDLPSMDDASLRRGRATTHTRYGEDQAILAGMSLIAEANQLLSRSVKDGKATLQKKLACLHILNGAFSVEGLSGGQSNDLLNKTSLSFEELEYIHSRKTGSLFVASVEIGAVLGDATNRERQWLVSYAKSLGLAFQIQDDLLDLEDASVTGKDRGQDQGKTTFSKIFGLEKCRRLYQELIDVACRNLETLRRRRPSSGGAYRKN